MPSATCEACGKTWSVPDADKVYRCKDCGGRVVGGVPASMPPVAPVPSYGESHHHHFDRPRADIKTRKRQLLIFGVAGIVLIAVMTALIMWTSPMPIEDGAAELMSVWQNGDYAAIEQLFTKDVLKSTESKITDSGSRMRELFELRGWLDGRPALSNPVYKSESDGVADVHFSLAGGTFITRWKRVGEVWRIAAFRYPNYIEEGDPPTADARQALAAKIGEFTEAWTGKRDEVINAMFIVDKRETWSGWMAKRGQVIKRSQLSGPTTDFSSRIRARTTFKTESGNDFLVDWVMVGKGWQVRGMRPME